LKLRQWYELSLRSGKFYLTDIYDRIVIYRVLDASIRSYFDLFANGQIEDTMVKFQASTKAFCDYCFFVGGFDDAKVYTPPLFVLF
jgi:hypothetical protein